MKAKTIRETFLQFFARKQHECQKAVPIVNKEDPSLLFVNAGMNPFKEIILGNQPITTTRVATAQPCLRVSGKHNDLEEVGIDGYHHTLFEMLGNWSFGDYFKKEAIAWAWELLTEVYHLPKERLYVTIFAGDPEDGLEVDHEAMQLWTQFLPQERILPFSKKDNFWEMGTQGPCGPCSEIHVDIRSEQECQAIPAAQLVNKDHPQVIEIWNLVFMQYNRQASGKLVSLSDKHIDTGMGLERLAMVLQGKQSTYDTDLFRPLVAELESIVDKKYDQSYLVSVAMRVIVDHLRAVVFAIADGQSPSNVKAGYVIRRILRRAIRYGYSYLDRAQPFIYQLVGLLVEQMADAYPQLSVQQQYIQQVIHAEEKNFLKTLQTGLFLFHQIEFQGHVVPGKVAFELYDTHGFPLDLTMLIAREQGLSVDEEAFHQALKEQKMRSKQDAATHKGDYTFSKNESIAPPCFVGYDQYSVVTSIVQWRTVSDKRGTLYEVVLAETPFYPEGGGQVADQGYLLAGDTIIPVIDVQKEHGLILHTIEQLPLSLTDRIEAHIDQTQRHLAANNHSATHLLHAALEKLLGDHVVQKSSLVAPHMLRFDFSHPEKLTEQQLLAVENMVNEKIRANIPSTQQFDVPIEEAKAMGATALFDEKYGSHVRVVTLDPTFSVVLCGGTHVQSTGQIGFFKIIKETGVGMGVRRIEALTAIAAEAWITQQMQRLKEVTSLLKQPKDLIKTVQTLIEEKSSLQKQVVAYKTKEVKRMVETLREKIEKVADMHLVIQEVSVIDLDDVKHIAMQYKNYAPSMVVVLAAKVDAQVQLAVNVSDLVAQTHSANLLIQSLAPLIGGQGGGTTLFATAKGNKPEGISLVLKKARDLLLNT